MIDLSKLVSGVSGKTWLYLGLGLAVVGSYAGIYFYAYSKGNANAEIAIAKYTSSQLLKTTTIQEKTQEANDKIVIKYVDRDHTITKYKTIYVEAAAELPKAPNFSNGWVNLHDAAVNETPITSVLVNDSGDSGISQATGLQTVISNYSTCKAIRNQLINLQDSVNKHNELVSKAK